MLPPPHHHRDVSVELPFVLMHPKPHDHITLPRPQTGERTTRPKPPARWPEARPGERRWSLQHPPTHPLSSPQLLLTQMPLWTPTSLSLIPSKTLLPRLLTFDLCGQSPAPLKSALAPVSPPPGGGREG